MKGHFRLTVEEISYCLQVSPICLPASALCALSHRLRQKIQVISLSLHRVNFIRPTHPGAVSLHQTYLIVALKLYHTWRDLLRRTAIPVNRSFPIFTAKSISFYRDEENRQAYRRFTDANRPAIDSPLHVYYIYSLAPQERLRVLARLLYLFGRSIRLINLRGEVFSFSARADQRSYIESGSFEITSNFFLPMGFFFSDDERSSTGGWDSTPVLSWKLNNGSFIAERFPEEIFHDRVDRDPRKAAAAAAALSRAKASRR